MYGISNYDVKKCMVTMTSVPPKKLTRGRPRLRAYVHAYTRARLVVPERTVAAHTVTVATATNVVLTPTPDFWQKRRSVAVNL